MDQWAGETTYSDVVVLLYCRTVDASCKNRRGVPVELIIKNKKTCLLERMLFTVPRLNTAINVNVRMLTMKSIRPHSRRCA